MRGLLLDLDGTVLDSLPGMHRAYNRALASVGLPGVPLDRLRPLIGHPIRVQLRLLFDLQGATAAAVEAAYGRHYREELRDGVAAYPDAEATLARLSGWRIGTMTTKRTDQAEEALRRAGLRRYFHAVVGGDLVARPKPAPDLPRRAMAALDVAPGATVVVGDNAVDVQAGRAAGARTVAALYGYGDRDALLAARPDATIAALRELPRVLARLPFPDQAQ